MLIKKLSEDIYLFENIIPPSDCQYIINSIEKYPAWEDAKVFGNLENYRKTKVDYLSNRYGMNSSLYKAHAILGYNFKLAFENLIEFYKYEDGQIYLSYSGDEGIQILKYQEDEYYREHIDAGVNLKRVHSCVMFINDEYLGGEIYFPRQKIKIKGKTGDLVFFPSAFTHPHIACEIKKGLKYTAVVWSY